MPKWEVTAGLTVMKREDVSHIAYLARLRLEPGELDLFTAQLNRILEHVVRLEAVDTSAAPPTASVLTGQAAPLREDEPRKGLAQSEVLEPAPASGRGFFRVPRIIE